MKLTRWKLEFIVEASKFKRSPALRRRSVGIGESQREALEDLIYELGLFSVEVPEDIALALKNASSAKGEHEQYAVLQWTETEAPMKDPYVEAVESALIHCRSVFGPKKGERQ
jgi:hypothetical protein